MFSGYKLAATRAIILSFLVLPGVLLAQKNKEVSGAGTISEKQALAFLAAVREGQPATNALWERAYAAWGATPEKHEDVNDTDALWKRAYSGFGGVTKKEESASPQLSGLPRDRYLRADELRKAGRNQEALPVAKEAIRFDSSCGRCFTLLASIEGNLQLYREGLADADIGVKLSKTSRDKAAAAYNKGFNLGGLGRESEALDAYNDSIRLDPTYEMGFFGKGKVLYTQGDAAKSKQALEQALKLNPKHGAAWAYIAEDQMNLGDAQGGLASANKAVELAPSDARSFRARTIAHYWEKNYAEMLADATRSLELDPSRPHAHLLRAHALKMLGRDQDAAKEYALEPDRQAVEAGMHPSEKVDLRIYNCGDYSTDIQTPQNFNVDGFSDCVKRVNDGLDDWLNQLEALPTSKHSVPGLPTKRPVTK